MSLAVQNQVPSEPSLIDLLNLHKKQILTEFSAHHVGTIQDFDSDTQTATVSINYKQTNYVLNPLTQNYDSVLKDYPALIDCPVICLGGGLANLTFPIQPGDECLVLFNDRDIDNWFSGATGTGVATARLHSISDGFALVGVRSLGKIITDYDAVRSVWSNGNAQISIGAELVSIKNESQNLKTILQDLCSKLQTLCTHINSLVSATAAITVAYTSPGGPAVAGPPINVAAINAVATNITNDSTAIAAVSTHLGALLE